MKNSLPTNHGLKQDLLDSPLVHRHEGQVSITDAQYAGLEAGCGRGESLLLVAPTSSGKTEVGLVAMTTWLRSGDGLGRVIFVAERPREQKAALRYLTDTLERRISGSIDPDLFDHTALQLVAAEIVQDEESLVALLLESLSAFVAGDRIRDIQGLWREKLAAALATLQKRKWLTHQ